MPKTERREKKDHFTVGIDFVWYGRVVWGAPLRFEANQNKSNASGDLHTIYRRKPFRYSKKEEEEEKLNQKKRDDQFHLSYGRVVYMVEALISGIFLFSCAFHCSLIPFPFLLN